jgi:NADH-quinone oxidoreductase subunit M
LPEVHCEANSSISLLSAGLLLKLGIFGMMRFILFLFFMSMRFLCGIVLCILLIGIILASCSSLRYYDLKKMIAFSSIIHLNLSFLSLFCMNGCGIIASIISSVSHSLSSSFLFLFSGLFINKVYSRYYESSFFFDQIMRSLLIIGILTNLGFAMTLNFVGEIFALIGLFSIDSL